MTKPPMSLAQVCSRWRSIVLTDRRNWTHIQLADVAPPMVEAGTSLLKLWISRSRGLNLSVHIPVQYPKALLDIIMEESDRWERLSLHQSMLETLILRKCSFPRLHTIHFLGPLMNGRKVATEPPYIVDQDLEYCAEVFPLRQITHLAIGADLPWLSQRFSSLVDLDLHCSTDLVQTLYNYPRTITFHRLEKLHLGFVGENASDIKTIASVLVVPKLHTLRVSEKPPLMLKPEHNRDTGCSCRAIHNLLLRSSCSLKALNLYNTYMKDESAFLECMKHVSDLMRLEIGGRRPAPVSDIFINLLSRYPSEASCLLPSLKVLDIKVPLYPDHETRLMEIIQKRGLSGEIDGNTAFRTAQVNGTKRRGKY
ncbi:hypothetical protein ONZ45_g405 [Pleurotus djamor]|nr:hypothetical protein ONZ45_g405 [Pleurotus djamor]